MENSKDKLFGFDLISDIFSENPTNTVEETEEELTDEELEELKSKSSKNRPPVPGKTKEDEKEEEETEEPEKVEDEPEEEPESEEDDDLEESEDESNKVTALFDAIAEELDWEFDEEEEKNKPKTVEDLVGYFKDVIKEQSVPQYASEEVQKIDEYVRNGGDLQKYFNVSTDIDYDNFDTTDESNQKKIVKLLLTEKGYNEKQITRKIEKYEDAGILEDEAEDALEELKEISENKKEQLLTEQKKRNEQREAQQQEFINSVVNEISSMSDIRGIKVPEKDKKALLSYIFKTDASGKTQYQKDYSKSVKNLIESAYFTMKGDTLLDTAKKIGTNSAIKNLKQSLRSTGVSKGTKRINTTHSNSIFSRAVQLL